MKNKQIMTLFLSLMIYYSAITTVMGNDSLIEKSQQEQENLRLKIEKFNSKYSINMSNLNTHPNYNNYDKYSSNEINSLVNRKPDYYIESHTNYNNNSNNNNIIDYLPERVNNIRADKIFYDVNLDEESLGFERLPLSSQAIFKKGNQNKYSYHEIIRAENEFFSKQNKFHKSKKELTRKNAITLRSKRLNAKVKAAASAIVKIKDDRVTDSRFINNIPYTLNFKKEKYIKISDIGSRGLNTWICTSKGEVKKFIHTANIATMDPVVVLKSDKGVCKRISVDISGLPVIINDKNEIADMRTIFKQTNMWEVLKVCAEDVTCGFKENCYFIPCQTDPNKEFLMKFDGTGRVTRYANLKPRSMKGYEDAISAAKDVNDDKYKKEASLDDLPALQFSKIAVGSGSSGDTLYLVSTKKELWKFEKSYWSLLEGNANDVSVSDRNDLFYSTDNGVYIWERDRLEPRKIFEGKVTNLAAGVNLWVQTGYDVIYSSINRIA